MDEIFSGGIKDERRIQLDDPNQGWESMWDSIAIIFNAHDKEFVNSWSEVDSRITHCDPSIPPDPDWKGADIRIWIQKYRSYFSRVSSKFRGTGKYDSFSGPGEGDKFMEALEDEFPEPESI